MERVFILSAARTPIGSFGGQLSAVSAIKLGATAIKSAITNSGIEANQIDEVFMGNVCSAGLGQAPARQAAIHAGIPHSVACTTINKVCSSGMKTIMIGAQSIMLGQNDIVVAGGMENMSSVPYYMSQMRWGAKYGSKEIIDGLEYDGLRDAYDQIAMGVFADDTASEYEISREEQDAYAIESYERAAKAWQSGAFSEEVVPVSVPQRKGDPLIINEDEEYKKVKFEKIPSLRAAFSKDGTVTAANASTINDGAAALVLISESKLKELGLSAMAEIKSFADGAHNPNRFTTAPTIAAPKALKQAGLTVDQIDLWEVNEAFSVVPLAFMKTLNIAHDKVNVNGGAVSIGHPLGASGARIVVTLLHAMKNSESRLGCAAICNGGGGASALILERT